MTVPGRPRSFDTDLALDAAVDVFWRRGYDGASLSELTTAMGINRPSLYAAFGDKDQLFQSALDRYVQRNMGYVTDALAQPTARNMAAAFLEGNAIAVTMPGLPAGCLSVQAAVATEGSAQLASLTENRARIQALFADRFRRAIDEGDLPADENPEEARSVPDHCQQRVRHPRSRRIHPRISPRPRTSHDGRLPPSPGSSTRTSHQTTDSKEPTHD